MNFIKNRLNKDNFWNLMFWFLMSTGIYSSFIISQSYRYLATTLLWLTIIGVPLLVKRFTKVSFDKDKNFINSQGKVLNKRHLKLFSLAIVATILLFVITGSVIDSFKHAIPDFLSFFIMINVFFFVPASYFILINCPISVIFNRKAWKEKIFGIHINNVSTHNISSSQIHNSTALKKFTSESLITSPGCSWYSGNIHNSRYHK